MLPLRTFLELAALQWQMYWQQQQWKQSCKRERENVQKRKRKKKNHAECIMRTLINSYLWPDCACGGKSVSSFQLFSLSHTHHSAVKANQVNRVYQEKRKTADCCSLSPPRPWLPFTGVTNHQGGEEGGRGGTLLSAGQINSPPSSPPPQR